MQEEDIIEGRDDAGGHYRRNEDEWRDDVQKEDIIEGRDEAMEEG